MLCRMMCKQCCFGFLISNIDTTTQMSSNIQSKRHKFQMCMLKHKNRLVLNISYLDKITYIVFQNLYSYVLTDKNNCQHKLSYRFVFHRICMLRCHLHISQCIINMPLMSIMQRKFQIHKTVLQQRCKVGCKCQMIWFCLLNIKLHIDSFQYISSLMGMLKHTLLIHLLDNNMCMSIYPIHSNLCCL